MARSYPKSYQRLEELGETPQLPKRETPSAKGSTPTVRRIIVFSLLSVALAASLFYAARMRDRAVAMETLADGVKKEALTVHQQVKILEGERDSLKVRVTELTSQLHKTQEDRDQLGKEVESLKKARIAHSKHDSRKARKRA